MGGRGGASGVGRRPVGVSWLFGGWEDAGEFEDVSDDAGGSGDVEGASGGGRLCLVGAEYSDGAGVENPYVGEVKHDALRFVGQCRLECRLEYVVEVVGECEV